MVAITHLILLFCCLLGPIRLLCRGTVIHFKGPEYGKMHTNIGWSLGGYSPFRPYLIVFYKQLGVFGLIRLLKGGELFYFRLRVWVDVWMALDWL